MCDLMVNKQVIIKDISIEEARAIIAREKINVVDKPSDTPYIQYTAEEIANEK